MRRVARDVKVDGEVGVVADYYVTANTVLSEMQRHAERAVEYGGRQAIHLHAHGEDCNDDCYFVVRESDESSSS